MKEFMVFSKKFTNYRLAAPTGKHAKAWVLAHERSCAKKYGGARNAKLSDFKVMPADKYDRRRVRAGYVSLGAFQSGGAPLKRFLRCV